MSFGNFHVGDAAPSQMLSLTNAVPNDGFSEALTISLDGVTGGVTADGDPISLLAPGGTNSTNLSVGIDTTTAGAKNGLATLNLTSDGAGSSGLGQTALASQSVNVIGSVYRLAQAGSVAPVAFGNFHVGDASPSRLLSLTNAAPNDGFSEALTISINGTTGGVTAGGGPISLLAPGATNGSSLTVGIDTTAAGSKNGLATLALTSDGAGSSGLGQTALTSQSVAVSGSVFRLANPTTPDGTTVDFGIVHVGDVVQRTVGVTNAAVNDGFSESLNASISSTTGPPAESDRSTTSPRGVPPTASPFPSTPRLRAANRAASRWHLAPMARARAACPPRRSLRRKSLWTGWLTSTPIRCFCWMPGR